MIRRRPTGGFRDPYYHATEVDDEAEELAYLGLTVIELEDLIPVDDDE